MKQGQKPNRSRHMIFLWRKDSLPSKIMTAVHNRKPADASALARPLRMQETIAELLLEAMTFCVESKVEETVRKWLTHADIAPDDPQSEERAAEAMIFALELSIFTPSMSGARPIDRMARQFKAKTFDEAAALEALKKARFTLFRILSATQSHVFEAEDLATGEKFLFLEQSLQASALAARRTDVTA
jgi:hypothetical protein